MKIYQYNSNRNRFAVGAMGQLANTVIHGLQNVRGVRGRRPIINKDNFTLVKATLAQVAFLKGE